MIDVKKSNVEEYKPYENPNLFIRFMFYGKGGWETVADVKMMSLQFDIKWKTHND